MSQPSTCDVTLPGYQLAACDAKTYPSRHNKLRPFMTNGGVSILAGSHRRRPCTCRCAP